MAETEKPIFWRRILAGILDFLLVFFGFGLLIATFTGDTSEFGFLLNGWPALLMIALVIAYFVIFNRYLGGTIFKRIFRIPVR